MDDDLSGARFSADESRAAAFTRGCYSVVLPDGRLQTVSYTVPDPEQGYVVRVSYDSQASCHQSPVPTPAYTPAPASTLAPTYTPIVYLCSLRIKCLMFTGVPPSFQTLTLVSVQTTYLVDI